MDCTDHHIPFKISCEIYCESGKVICIAFNNTDPHAYSSGVSLRCALLLVFKIGPDHEETTLKGRTGKKKNFGNVSIFVPFFEREFLH